MSPSLCSWWVTEKTFPVVLIGLAAASSISLAVLLLWACFSWRLRGAVSQTHDIWYFHLLSDFCLPDPFGTSHSFSRTDARLLPWSWGTLVCWWSCWRRGKPVKGPLQDPKYDSTPHQMVWKKKKQTARLPSVYIHQLLCNESFASFTSLHSIHKNETFPISNVISVTTNSKPFRQKDEGAGKQRLHRGGKRYQDIIHNKMWVIKYKNTCVYV